MLMQRLQHAPQRFIAAQTIQLTGNAVCSVARSMQNMTEKIRAMQAIHATVTGRT